mgnify:FL=1
MPNPSKAPIVNGHRPKLNSKVRGDYRPAPKPPEPIKLPIDSSLLPWEEIFALRPATYPDGVL